MPNEEHNSQKSEEDKVLPYKVISSGQKEDLEQQVGKAMLEGYVLYGALGVSIFSQEVVYSQVMVLPHIRSADHYIMLSNPAALWACKEQPAPNDD